MANKKKKKKTSYILSPLDLYFDYVGVNISPKNSLLFFFNVYASLMRFSSTDSKTDSLSPPLLPLRKSFDFGKDQLPSSPLRLIRCFQL